ARTTKVFGPIPSADPPPRKKATAFKDRAGPVRKEFESKFEAPRMLLGFNTAAVGDPDDPVLDYVQHVLTDGKTSRLYRLLVEDDRLASARAASQPNGSGPGWVFWRAGLVTGEDRKKAEGVDCSPLEELVKQLST